MSVMRQQQDDGHTGREFVPVRTHVPVHVLGQFGIPCEFACSSLSLQAAGGQKRQRPDNTGPAPSLRCGEGQRLLYRPRIAGRARPMSVANANALLHCCTQSGNYMIVHT